MLLSDSELSSLPSCVVGEVGSLGGVTRLVPFTLVPICPGGIRALSPLKASKEALGTQLCPQGAAGALPTLLPLSHLFRGGLDSSP